MAATDQTYRNQKKLDFVFGVSCVLMLGSVLWMFAQDYNREWKTVQREFRDVEEALNEHMMLKTMPSRDAMEEKNKAARQARNRLETVRDKIGDKERQLLAQRDTQDNKYRSIKAEFDSKMSYYNIAYEHYGRADSKHRVELKKDLDRRKEDLDRLQKELADAQDDLDKTERQIKELERTEVKIGKNRTATLESAQGDVARTEDDLKRLTRQFDVYAKATAKGGWKLGDTFRDLPILDAFESPTKIKQLWLPELTIEYGSFKEVPRYDRCTSCHLAIDRAGYDKATLRELSDEANRGRLHKKLLEAEQIFTERKRDGENLGFDPADLPTQTRGSAWKPALFVLLTTLLLAGIFGFVEHSVRLAISITMAGTLLTVVWGLLVTFVAPKDPTVKIIPLTSGQVTEYCAHPRLDLFVDPASPHPMEKFGCTTCHAGQGSATDFLLAAHTPADTRQEEHWEKEYGWEASHFWDFPMLSSRFVESTCLKCHHQVTDLVRYGSKEEAPKVLKGYELVRENGCFGCHEIAGIKGFREGPRAVGPDLRLEPSPALDFLTSAEQEKAKSDPANPPGTFRKAGPSLRRLAEKTNQGWTRRWLYSPRGFRPDTKMPHFYNLSNNTPNSRIEELPEDQKKFPDTEMHAIAYYLVTESQASLEGRDSARKALEGRLNDLQGQLGDNALRDRDRKELIDVTRRLTDIGLLSAPRRARQINATSTQLRNLQERMQDLYEKQANLQAQGRAAEFTSAEKKELEDGKKQLKVLGDELITEGLPAPLLGKDGKPLPLVAEDGSPVPLPAPVAEKDKAAHLRRGRELFTEKGCLACHTHSSTEKKDQGLPAVMGQANFAPNLSRIAAKIIPQVPAGTPADQVQLRQRTWLVQWIMNPNIHHPRTRMPITHLTAEQAAAVADWLLSQEVKGTDGPNPEGWDVPDPTAPGTDDLVALARVYLAKAPGMTHQDVEEILPPTGTTRQGLTVERARLIREQSPDADELRLEGTISDDEAGRGKLLWYIGRKAIGRLGCFGCHDLPGFEQSKPIGTALNDWGKKDPERLAFEDSDIYVKQVYNVVDVRNDPKDPHKPAGDWKAEGNHRPFEKYFYEALEHHHRQGFLHLKLMDPRSYDYHRIRTWDDRLRMPQFRFARSHRRDKESDADYQARLQREAKGEYDAQAELEEAEAREAVMTFVLGLVAEPVPLKYLHKPGPDRLAEVKGLQVLEKFNCAGCHQVRPGVFEVKTSPETLEALQKTYKDTIGSTGVREDYYFAGHNAWVGLPQPSSDRLLVFGTTLKSEEEEANRVKVRLADALRFAGTDGVVRDLRAGLKPTLSLDQLTSAPVPPYGGTFTELMIDYWKAREATVFKTDDDARAVLPPPLHREGERVQPNWLYSFLLNPGVIRPQGYLRLRMPKFNMSNEDARALVDYFGAASRLGNPGAGVTAQYVTVDQREPDFWRKKTERYVKRLSKEQLDARAKEMVPAWEQELERRKADATSDKARQEWEEKLKKKDFGVLRQEWEQEQVYAMDALRTIANKDWCLQCHSIGRIEIDGPKGPNLALTADRLRPEWLEQWIAMPSRMFAYDTTMPQNFPNAPEEMKQRQQQNKVWVVGTPLEVVEAARDVLMDLPRLENLPGTRKLAPAAAPTPEAGGKQ
jgi:mono/diheme cytochrome c family protein